MEKINLASKLASFEEAFSPRIVAQLNDYKVVVVKIRGDFVWHAHEATDELFLVLGGSMTIELREHEPVTLGPGELFVVPRGTEHRPRAETEAEVLLIEPLGTPNTGGTGGELTAPEQRI